MSNGQTPVYYPMPRGTNWAAIVAGLAAVGLGSYAIYWLWKNGYFNPGGNTACSQYTHEYDCTSHGCYWWGTPASCHEAPEGYVSCSSLGGGCLLDGLRRCDYIVPSDLCECDGTTGNYTLVQHNNQACINNDTYLDCFIRTDTGKTQCAPTVGSRENVCYATNFDYGCSCSAGTCSSTATCYNGICYRRATGALMNITEDMWTSWLNSGGWSATYDLKEGQDPNYPFPFAASQVSTAKIHYKWGPLPGSGGGAYLKGYDGNNWHTLWENNNIWYWGDNGDINIDASFSLVGIEKIEVKTWCVGTNIKPVYFQGLWYG